MFLWQLRLMREGLDEAKTAASAARDGALAARDSADTAKLTMIASGRAYVHHHDFTWVYHREIRTNLIFWRIRLCWINVGDTPTRRLRIYTGYTLLDTELPEDFAFLRDPRIADVFSVLNPRGTADLLPMTCSEMTSSR
jgi:hypothetical protein